MQSNHSGKRRSVLLGIFIILQLAFLFVQNLFSFLQELQAEMPSGVQSVVRQIAPDWPDKKGHIWNAMEGATQITHRWSQATLQLQTWSLFAPTVGRQCVFPALLLSDDEPPDAPVAPLEAPFQYEVHGKLVLSDNEPPDLRRYVRWGNFRLRRFENNLAVYLTPRPEETLAFLGASNVGLLASPLGLGPLLAASALIPGRTATLAEINERFQKRIKDNLTENAEMLGAYLKFRLSQLDVAPPRQVILVMRRYSLKSPKHGADFLEGPFTTPVLRWLPHADPDAAKPTLQYFDPKTQRFESL